MVVFHDSRLRKSVRKGITKKGDFMALKVEFREKIFTPAIERTVERLAAGESYQETADELHRDKETVKSYAAVFRQAMHAKSMVEAVAKAVARGVISIKEIDVKSVLACAFIGLTGFNSDAVMARTARTVRTTRTARQKHAATQSENGVQVVYEGLQSADFRTVVSSGLSSSAVR